MVLAQLIEFLDGAQGDASGGGLVHGMDLDARVVEGKDLVGLQAVGEESAGKGGAHDERDDGGVAPSGLRGRRRW